MVRAEGLLPLPHARLHLLVFVAECLGCDGSELLRASLYIYKNLLDPEGSSYLNSRVLGYIIYSNPLFR